MKKKNNLKGVTCERHDRYFVGSFAIISLIQYYFVPSNYRLAQFGMAASDHSVTVNSNNFLSSVSRNILRNEGNCSKIVYYNAKKRSVAGEFRVFAGYTGRRVVSLPPLCLASGAAKPSPDLLYYLLPTNLWIMESSGSEVAPDPRLSILFEMANGTFGKLRDTMLSR